MLGVGIIFPPRNSCAFLSYLPPLQECPKKSPIDEQTRTVAGYMPGRFSLISFVFILAKNWKDG